MRTLPRQTNHLLTTMESNIDPDGEAMLRDYVNFEQCEEESVETPQNISTIDSRNQPVFDINNIHGQPDPHSVRSQDELESSQPWIDPLTIQPRQLDSMSQALSPYNPLSTANLNKSQNSPSPSTEQPSVSTQPRRRLRRLKPAPARESKRTSLESSPSWTDTSSSTSGPAMEGSSQPTPQANIHTGPNLVCQCGFKARIPSRLRKHQLCHDPQLQCDTCGKMEAYQRDLDRHIRVAHPSRADELGIRRFNATCPTCGKHFTRMDNMVKHSKIKHGTDE